ncbi:MAG: tetratricopeptide repeat protein, partial [Spirulinaceae cyanobacterium]
MSWRWGVLGAVVLSSLAATGPVAAIQEPGRAGGALSLRHGEPVELPNQCRFDKLTDHPRYGSSTHETRSAGVPACPSHKRGVSGVVGEASHSEISPTPELEFPREWLLAQNAETSAAEQLFNEGMSLFQQGSAASLQAAIEKFDAAIRLYQAENNSLGEAFARLALGRAYDLLGFKSEALESYEKSLAIWQALAPQTSGKNLQTVQGWEATTLNNIGLVYSSLGEKSRALEYFEQALPLRRAVGDRGGEATTLNNIGLVYSSIGEKSRALEYYEQALPLLRAVGDRGGEANTLSNIGAVYSSLGEKSRALEYFEQA